jgi:hypothetical protein
MYDKRDDFNFKIIIFPIMYRQTWHKCFYPCRRIVVFIRRGYYQYCGLSILIVLFWVNFVAEFLPLIYPPELEVKETTDTASSASCLDLSLEFDDSGQLSTKMYYKRDDFNFKIISFPIMYSNIPASNVINIPVCEIKGSSLMNLLIVYKRDINVSIHVDVLWCLLGEVIINTVDYQY